MLWDIPEFVGVMVLENEGQIPSGVAGGTASLLAGLPETEAAVLSGVGLDPRGVDVVARRSGVEMPEVLPALALLELKGFVSRDGVGAYVRRAVP